MLEKIKFPYGCLVFCINLDALLDTTKHQEMDFLLIRSNGRLGGGCPLYVSMPDLKSIKQESCHKFRVIKKIPAIIISAPISLGAIFCSRKNTPPKITPNKMLVLLMEIT